MKVPKVPQRLTASDEDIARLFGALDDDAPAPEAQAAILARIDAAARAESGDVPAAPGRVVFRNGLIVTGLLATALVASSASRGARHASAPSVSTASLEAPPPADSPRSEHTFVPSAVELPGEPSTPGVAVGDLPTAPVPALAPRSAPSARASDGNDSFREQLALVESARHSLSKGKTDDCLATLQRYDQKFPSGVFMAEVRMVRIEALNTVGRADEARRLARGLLASDPKGPYADRLRALFPQLDEIDR